MAHGVGVSGVRLRTSPTVSTSALTGPLAAERSPLTHPEMRWAALPLVDGSLHSTVVFAVEERPGPLRESVWLFLCDMRSGRVGVYPSRVAWVVSIAARWLTQERLPER